MDNEKSNENVRLKESYQPTSDALGVCPRIPLRSVELA